MQTRMAWVLMLALGCDPSAGEEAGFAFTDEELDTHDQIDAYRTSQGLDALEADDLIGELARAHSEAMLAGQVEFGHGGFEERSAEMFDGGFLGAGENVAFSQRAEDPVDTAVQGWIDSPGHHENIVGEWTHAGVGIASDGETYYLTQIFGSR